MTSGAEPIIRDARADDVAAVCRFGATHIPPHYAPLIGASAAAAQVSDWWSEARIATAVAAGLVVVAELDGRLVGVAQRGADHVLYKLYLDPAQRGRGLGPRLLDAVIRRLPPDAERLSIEHFAANERAARFYEREGFAVDRIDPSATGDPRLAVVWRSRRVTPAERR